MSTKHLTMFAIAACLILVSCATPAQTATTAGAGVAGLVAFFDSLTKSGVLNEVQGLQIEHTLQGVQTAMDQTAQLAAAAAKAAQEARDNGISPETASTVGVAGAALTATVFNAWRNTTRAKALATKADAA
jgi:hypothetical protein